MAVMPVTAWLNAAVTVKLEPANTAPELPAFDVMATVGGEYVKENADDAGVAGNTAPAGSMMDAVPGPIGDCTLTSSW